MTVKFRIENNVKGYFDRILKAQVTGERVVEGMENALQDFRIMEKIYDCNMTISVPLIIKI